MSALHTGLDAAEVVGDVVGGAAKTVGGVAGVAGVGVGAYETIDKAAHGDAGGAAEAAMATAMPLLGALAPLFGVGYDGANAKNQDTGMTSSQEAAAGYQSSAPAPAPAAAGAPAPAPAASEDDSAAVCQ